MRKPSRTCSPAAPPPELRSGRKRQVDAVPETTPNPQTATMPPAEVPTWGSGLAKPEPTAEAAQLRAELRRLTTELAQARSRIAELEDFAETDFLLGIPNRRGFDREMRRAIAYLRRYGASAALIALDVDGLKPINDSYGHAAGDAVLKGIVNVILRHIRSSDVLARLGGDEFAVLLWNLDEANARAKAVALEGAVDRLTFVFRGKPIAAGASTGVTVIAPSDDVAAALDRADREMYQRKTLRRGRSS